VLVQFAGGYSVAGKKLKSQTGWDDYNGTSGNGTDDFGFSALPGGSRYTDGYFDYVGWYGYWWSATEYGSGLAYQRDMYSDYGSVGEDINYKGLGVSVRCLRD
jgi:uncharacterized protein (TIGR02145 family)